MDFLSKMRRIKSVGITGTGLLFPPTDARGDHRNWITVPPHADSAFLDYWNPSQAADNDKDKDNEKHNDKDQKDKKDKKEQKENRDTPCMSQNQF